VRGVGVNLLVALSGNKIYGGTYICLLSPAVLKLFSEVANVKKVV
jgi:hypothetical protein